MTSKKTIESRLSAGSMLVRCQVQSSPMRELGWHERTVAGQLKWLGATLAEAESNLDVRDDYRETLAGTPAAR